MVNGKAKRKLTSKHVLKLPDLEQSKSALLNKVGTTRMRSLCRYAA
jgi:hypothetical protein